MTPTKITLGEHEVDVLAQRHAYLENKLGKWFGTFVESSQGLDSGQLLNFLGGNVYEVLSTLIPTLPKRMPSWEFDGFGSAEAAANKDYDETLDKSPTVPEIIEAFEAAIEVNRFDIFKVLGKIVDPQMLRALINERIAAAVSNQSQNSPLPSGESDQTNSGTTAPTSIANAA